MITFKEYKEIFKEKNKRDTERLVALFKKKYINADKAKKNK